MGRIAFAAEQSGDPASALAFYRRAIELQPDSIAARIGAARALAAQGLTDEAINTLRSAHDRVPSNAEVSTLLGRLLLVAGQAPEALQVLQNGLRQTPDSVPLLIAQGGALDKLGRFAEAQTSYRQALKLAPDSTAAKQDLALSLTESGSSNSAHVRSSVR